MNIFLKLDQRTFAVEVGDLAARPIVAVVAGERFEVWPEENATLPAAKPPAALASPPPQAPPARVAPSAAPPQTAPSTPTNGAAVVLAPLPGVIVAVAAQPGQTVAVGQELCTIEAMKMKNVIRANRAGTVKAVAVSVGQTVKQRQLLVEYEQGGN